VNRTRTPGPARRRRRLGVSTLAVGAAMMLTLSACGSDADASDPSTVELVSTAPPATESSPTDSAAEVDMAAACDTWIAADAAVIGFQFAGEGDATSVNAAIDSAIAAADPANEQTLTDLQASVQEQLEDPESEGNDETFSLYSDAITWAGESCDVETFDVTAVDYGYEGVPATLSTGYHIVNFTNTGDENHEMFAFRFNEGTTESIDELFALPEEEVFSKITPVNATFAPSGGADTISWNLTEPGQYAVFCAIPVGSIGEVEGDGAPHFTQGMIEEFTVS